MKVYLLTLSVSVILMIISISIHYDAGNECAVIHTIQLESLHATVLWQQFMTVLRMALKVLY